MSLNINVLVTAREEYLSQLMDILIGFCKPVLKKMFHNSQKNAFFGYKYREFQEALREIQGWNDVVVNDKVKDLCGQCPYFSELLKAIFVINVKIMSCVKFNPKGKGIKIEIPQLNLFVHKLFIEIGRKFYYEPTLITEPDTEIDDVIESSITELLRKQIPIQQILQEYLMGSFDNESDASEEEAEAEEAEEEEDKQSEVHKDELKEIDGLTMDRHQDPRPPPPTPNVSPEYREEPEQNTPLEDHYPQESPSEYQAPSVHQAQPEYQAPDEQPYYQPPPPPRPSQSQPHPPPYQPQPQAYQPQLQPQLQRPDRRVLFGDAKQFN